MKKETLDTSRDAVMALIASGTGEELREIRSIASRLSRLVRRLEKYSFPLVAAPLSGLLTRPENHTANTRIETLIHLALLGCQGDRMPDARKLRELLNVAIYNDVITELEVPVEDVFVSNVETGFGNARLFEGRWENNSEYVRACVDTLHRITEHPWAVQTLGHVNALLRVSEAVAERAGIERYSRTVGKPRDKIAAGVSVISESASHVVFSEEELISIGVEPGLLNPFLIQGEHAELLIDQSLGHTVLERRPLVRFKGQITVVLPNAIGAAIRRFVIDQASEEGDLRKFQETYHLAQFTEIFLLGRPDWSIGYNEMLEPDPGDGMREFVGTFDKFGYVHLVFIPDDFKETSNSGLSSTHLLDESVRERIQDRVNALACKEDCLRGLLVLVHGGIGRGFSPVWGDMPLGWHQICVSAPDFLLLGNKDDFNAKRAWKLLQQVHDLDTMGVYFPNLRGFLNMVAFAYHAEFELVPVNMEPAPIYLHSDFILPFRHKVRTLLDRHASLALDGKAWVKVQGQAADDYLDAARAGAIYFSSAHRVEKEIMACAEIVTHPWWVHCNQFPEDCWHQGIIFNVLNMILSWLTRLIPVLEERCIPLPSGPVTFRIQFSDIEKFDQRDTQIEQTPVAPTVMVENGEITIDCKSSYLISFLKPGNPGDRLMVTSLIRGVNLLCGRENDSEADIQKLVGVVVVSDHARFLKMTPSHTPEDLIYDSVKLPETCMLMPEDLAWSRFDLVRRAGYEGNPGKISAAESGNLIEKAVDVVWSRVKSRLMTLSRETVIERSLLNYIASRREHRDWQCSISAQLALYETSLIMDVANARTFRLDCASIASRVIAEMALCTSPYNGGETCTEIDMDFLVAEVTTLLECAHHGDALRYGLTTQPPAMNPNGSFEFDSTATQVTNSLLTEHLKRKILNAVHDDEEKIHEGTPDPNFSHAFTNEFDITLEQFAEFITKIAWEAVEHGRAHLWFRRTEVINRLQCVGARCPEKTFEKLALVPREKWDEGNPENALARDWYPWRYARRLSIMRRPFIQMSLKNDPFVIIVPSILSGTLDFLNQAAFGELPETLFDSPEMKACVGRAADKNGHEFAKRVARCLGEYKWETELELNLTQFGGNKSLGDIDVLGWQPVSGIVYVIECKSLRFDRTLGEVGERLEEYSLENVSGKRSPLQKHLDRMSFLEANRERIADFTGIGVNRLELRSGLITEQLVPMQFGGKARGILDLVTDYEGLEKVFENN